MKKFLILTALGLFLAAHGAVALMTVYPQSALAACGTSGCGSPHTGEPQRER